MLAALMDGGCLITIDDHISCGDGFVDLAAGEQCDPEAAAEERVCGSLRSGFSISGCDPVSCQCTTCGDGLLDQDSTEQCDGPDLGGASCTPDAAFVGLGEQQVYVPACTTSCQLDRSTCPKCGNGVREALEECDDGANGDDTDDCTDRCRTPVCGDGILQPGEECEISIRADDFGVARACSELQSRYGETQPYTSGTTSVCLARGMGLENHGCMYSRRNCGFCGNGRVDDGENFTDGTSTPNEICDGDAARKDELRDHCRQVCVDSTLTELNLECNFTCGDNCVDFAEHPQQDLGCCLAPREACPTDDSAFPCCWALKPENERSGEDPCEEVFEGGGLARVCRGR